MREDMPDRAELVAVGRRMLAPLATGKRRHSTEHAFDRPANQPDMTVALDPIGDAVFVRANTPKLWRRKRFGVAAGIGCAMRRERAVAAARVPGPADGRSKVHHRLDEIAGPITGHHRQREALDLDA